MSNDIQKADQIAFHFYTKLFYTVNHARATDEAASTRVDKWFNLESPDSDLFSKDSREPYRSISLAPPGPPPLEIQVLLCVPELGNNQMLVHTSPSSFEGGGGQGSSRLRIEPTPRYVLLETWTLEKHGIVLFRSVFSLLRVLPAWKAYKRLKRRIGRNGLAIR
ncbi:hypothetical protein CVT26_005965, partial [Gymnopilus dilepis]